MSTYQPNWRELEEKATHYINSSLLTTQIKNETPYKGFVFTNLKGKLSSIIKTAIKTQSHINGGLVIVVDTLTVEEGKHTVPTIGLEIIARSIEIVNHGKSIIEIDSPSASFFQLTTSQISGSLDVCIGKNSNPVGINMLSKKAPPQAISLMSGSNVPIQKTSTEQVADIFHTPWSILGLELSFFAASYLAETNNKDALQFASKMLRWVTGASYALLKERNSIPFIDISNIASLQANSMALLSITQASFNDATFVPALSVNMYEKEMNSLLTVASDYNQEINNFIAQKNIDELLNNLASTLNSINNDARTPLFNTLKRLANDAQLAQSQMSNSAIQLENISKTFPALQDAVQKAVEDQFQKELLETAFKTLFTLITLYISVGAIIVDPELIGAEAGAIAKAALEIVEKLAEAGENIIDEAITSGSDATTVVPPTIDTYNEAGKGAQVLMGVQTGFGLASSLLWKIVDDAIANGENKINFSPDLVKVMDKIPNLNSFSVGGLDPTTYWDTMVVQVKASLQPLLNGPETGAPARAYIEAMELASTYGKGIGDQQSKLLELYNQGMAAFDQLRAIDQAEEQWNSLQKKLIAQEDKINAAIGFLERGYTKLKRNIVISVNNYRAAFYYQWLQESSVIVNTSMTYLQLVQAVENSIDSLKNVLNGTLPNVIKPRQNFNDVEIYIRSVNSPLFTEVNGKGQAKWAITTDNTTLSDQLNGNTALYITEATFELQGAQQVGEVELQIETSANYANKLNKNEFRFVSTGFSMSSDYKPDKLPNFITKWQFAKEDAPNYLTPTPYSQFTLTVDQGNWKDVTAIKMTVSGIEIQNVR